VVPPALGDLSGSPLKGLFEVGIEESKQLASAFQAVGDKESLRLFFFDEISPNGIGEDGIHLNKIGHRELGLALADGLEK
ncbi:MAG: hypothetical protein AAF546_12800, partial [Verrucomicrobiota bacterium]